MLLGRKALTNLDSILKSRDVTLLTKVHLVKAMGFPVVMYGCESMPRQVDKKSGVPKEAKGVCGSLGGDRGLEFSRRRKGETLFFSTFLSLSHIKPFFFH